MTIMKPIETPITGPGVWRGEDLQADAGRITVSAAAAREIAGLVETLRANPLPMLALRPDDFDLPACRAMMEGARSELLDGRGFVLIDRLDLEIMSTEEAKAVYWLLASMVARPVAQKWDGTMVYDVHDTGKKPGNGVRPDITNAEQNFHTDNSYNLCPPEHVGLFCLAKAKEGGMSKIVSFPAAHEAMRQRHPDLLRRLYSPFFFDRQREHAPDDGMTTHHPMFENHGGRLVARLSRFQVVNGYKLAGEALDSESTDAIEALEEIMNEPGMGLEFWFEPGQIQIVNNRQLGHRRTGFVDFDEPERRRRLVRLWLRDEGRAFYNG